MSLRSIAKRAKEEYDNSSQVDLIFSRVEQIARERSQKGAINLSLSTYLYTELSRLQKDYIVNTLVSRGFSAYFMGGTLCVSWGDATHGVAKEVLDSMHLDLEAELSRLIHDQVVVASSLGYKGCYFYFTDWDFSNLLRSYSRENILSVLRKYFKVTEGSFQEIYVAWA